MGPSGGYTPGALVNARGRDWVVLPPEEPDVVRLRPVDGSEAESVGIYIPLEPEALKPSEYQPPDPDLSGDFTGALLLRDAVRLSLRSGAGPFRSMGHLSVAPRPYQFVPLIMALRLDPDLLEPVAPPPHKPPTSSRLPPRFLRVLASARTAPADGIDREEQFYRLKGQVDPGSSLEGEFLQFLYDANMRLPDRAQNRPSREVYVQPDFYYERENLPGVCVFVDGPHHDAPEQRGEDARLRAQLQDRGFRVISIRHDQPFAAQIKRHPDVFVVEA